MVRVKYTQHECKNKTNVSGKTQKYIYMLKTCDTFSSSCWILIKHKRRKRGSTKYCIKDEERRSKWWRLQRAGRVCFFAAVHSSIFSQEQREHRQTYSNTLQAIWKRNLRQHLVICSRIKKTKKHQILQIPAVTSAHTSMQLLHAHLISTIMVHVWEHRYGHDHSWSGLWQLSC